jgi:flagellar basal-body rod protein FlgC
MFSSLDISTSALVAQRTRMDVISANLANMSTTRNESGEAKPYQRRDVVLQTEETAGKSGAAGVKVAAVEIEDAEPRWKLDPGNVDAVKDPSDPHYGYVAYPAIDMMTEFTDALTVARAYEANLGAIDIAKDMAQQTLRILI